MSEQHIYKAITGAMKDIEPIAKNRKNQQQGFLYRGVDDVMTELAPILVKHGIFIVPEVMEQKREERQTKGGSTLNYSILKVAFHFTTDDGSKITAVVIGEGMDSGDKASNKALSIAFKYACLQVFCIPTEDSKDPDDTTPPSSAPMCQKPPKSTGSHETSLAEQRNKIIAEIKDLVQEQAPDGMPYFTKAEVEIVKGIVVKTGPYERGIKILEDQLNKLRLSFEEKEAAYVNNAANDVFQDDIPF
jgi:hypothetical protein